MLTAPQDLSNVLDAYRELSKIISSVVRKQREDATKQSLSMNDLTGALRETVVNVGVTHRLVEFG